MDNKYLILIAQLVSLVFSPFHMPVLAFIVLLLFSYMSMTPLVYKVYVLAIVYIFTILLPRFSIFLYRKINGWTRHHLGKRANRFVPYFLSIVNYGALLYVMASKHMPRFTLGIISAALCIQLTCAFINNWLKVSTHAAASGGVIGALLAFSYIFSFDPTFWLCLSIFLTGIVCSARLVLRQHQLLDVGIGSLVGFVCGFVCLLI